MIEYELKNVISALEQLDYKIFTKPYMLNIVGIRSTEQPNKFDDTMFVFWKNDSNVWNYSQYPVTTDTGTFWLKSPFDKKLGAGMMKAGQYIVLVEAYNGFFIPFFDQYNQPGKIIVRSKKYTPLDILVNSKAIY